MGVNFSQFFPPNPTLTEKNLPSQKGKVFIITGGASGIGYQLAAILFQAGGKVYIAGRSEANAMRAIEEITSSTPEGLSPGQLEYLPLELDDLSTIKSSAEAFKSKESKLDVLWNNAGVSLPPTGSVTKQGKELQLGTNCLGPLLFTQLLLPSLRVAAQTSPPGSVRVVWTSSSYVDLTAPIGGINISDLENLPNDQAKIYTASKTGNWFLANELAQKVAHTGILSVTQHPGNLKTNLLRHTSQWMQLAVRPLLYHAKMGAYTELWAGLSPELNMEMNGSCIIAWGRVHPSPRKDMLDALRSVEDGGTGQAGEFWNWCEKQIAEYK